MPTKTRLDRRLSSRDRQEPERISLARALRARELSRRAGTFLAARLAVRLQVSSTPNRGCRGAARIARTDDKRRRGTALVKLADGSALLLLRGAPPPRRGRRRRKASPSAAPGSRRQRSEAVTRSTRSATEPRTHFLEKMTTASCDLGRPSMRPKRSASAENASSALPSAGAGGPLWKHVLEDHWTRRAAVRRRVARSALGHARDAVVQVVRRVESTAAVPPRTRRRRIQ